jgi:hypothetical protein
MSIPGVVNFARLENMVYEPEDRITVYTTKDRECAALYGIGATVTLNLFLKEVRLQNNSKYELPDLRAWTTTAICDQHQTFSRRVLHSSMMQEFSALILLRKDGQDLEEAGKAFEEMTKKIKYK